MSFQESYTQVDFLNSTKVNLNQLQTEIIQSTITSVLYNTTGSGDFNGPSFQVSIFFESQLSNDDKTTLNSLIANYIYKDHPLNHKNSVYEVIVSNDPLNPGDYKSVSEAFEKRGNIGIRKERNIL